MKMTEIYDVTDADTDAVQSPTERDVNKQLEFDNDWSTDYMPENGKYCQKILLLNFEYFLPLRLYQNKGFLRFRTALK